MNVIAWAVLLVLCCIGNYEWWVILVNRSHAMGAERRRLRRFRTFHDAGVLLYPVVMVWRVPMSSIAFASDAGPGDLWSMFSSLDRCLLLWGLSGCVPFAWVAARWRIIGKAEYFACDQTQTFDVFQTLMQRQSAAAVVGDPDAKHLRTQVQGTSRHGFLLFPWNQVFRLEVNRKTISWDPGAKAETPGPDCETRTLRIVHLSDLHLLDCPGEAFYRFVVEKAVEFQPDAFVLSGDLLDDIGLLGLAADILRPLPQLAPSFLILGNHDCEFSEPQIRRAFTDTGWIDVGSRNLPVTLHGMRVRIAGNERPWTGMRPPAIADSEADLKIVISHSPDFIHDAIRDGYDLMLSGHTHGGQVVLPLIGPVYAPSRFGTRYASGLFSRGPLRVHVSRGIGANDPLRFGSCPELTLLTVHVRPRLTSSRLTSPQS
ncbi:MAG: metallophosphoesterase [Planctomycetaceae bacterium]|nr:metallophosphoesterase [Planctomycetaceae bacterium]